jgi:hypothetical protein
MDDEPGRFVDDEEVLVLVGDAQIELLGLERRRPSRRYVELELLAAFEPVALRADGSVDEHSPLAEETLRSGARADLLETREEAVEPLAGRRRRHGDGVPAGHGAGALARENRYASAFRLTGEPA